MIQIDQALPSFLQREIYEITDDDNFNWYLRDSQISKPEILNGEELQLPWLSHYTVIQGNKNSEITELTNNILYCLLNNTNKIKDISILESRINCTFKYPYEGHTGIHKDSVSGATHTLLYYINNNDGNTLFFDDNSKLINKIVPRINRAVLFDANTWHAATPPRNYNTKKIINYNLKLTFND